MEYEIQEVQHRKQWDQFIERYGDTSLFQTWQWGEVVSRAGQNVKRFGLYDHGELKGICQCAVVTAKRGSYVHVRHGPIFIEEDKQYWNEMTTFLISFTKKQHALFFRVSPLIHVNAESLLHEIGYVSAPIHAMDAELCWVLDLTPTEDELLKNMRKTTRYEIRRAQSLGVNVTASTDPSDLVKFIELYKETAKRQGFVPHGGIEAEFEIFAQAQELLIFLGWHNDEVISGAIVLYCGSQGIYHHGASLSNKIPASYLVQWHAILEAKKRGKRLYNFWGIAPTEQANHPWQGLTLFKKGFGGSEVQFMHAHDYPVSPLYLFPRAIDTWRRIKKGY